MKKVERTGIFTVAKSNSNNLNLFLCQTHLCFAPEWSNLAERRLIGAFFLSFISVAHVHSSHLAGLAEMTTTTTVMVLLQNRFHRDFTNFGGSSVWKYMFTTLRADNADADDGRWWRRAFFTHRVESNPEKSRQIDENPAKRWMLRWGDDVTESWLRNRIKGR